MTLVPLPSVFVRLLAALPALTVALWLPATSQSADPAPGSAAVVEAGNNVSIEYTLRLDDGTQVDSNVGGEPIRIQQGAGQVLDDVDAALIGMQIGESKQVTVLPQRGYGEVNPDAFQTVPLSDLPEEARQPGVTVRGEDEQGQSQRVRVDRIEGDNAVIDLNHELAGKKLVFDVKLLAIE